MDAINIKNLSKSFGAHRLLESLDMIVPAGSIFGLVGENGAGKTTTMKIILGLLAGDGGSIFADVKNGELHRADFILATCSQKGLDAIKARRSNAAVSEPQLDQEQRAESDGNEAGKQGGENQEESFHAFKTRRAGEKLQGLRCRRGRTLSVAP